MTQANLDENMLEMIEGFLQKLNEIAQGFSYKEDSYYFKFNKKSVEIIWESYHYITHQQTDCISEEFDIQHIINTPVNTIVKDAKERRERKKYMNDLCKKLENNKEKLSMLKEQKGKMEINIVKIKENIENIEKELEKVTGR